MKQFFYSILTLIGVMCAGNARAQYTITSNGTNTTIDSFCAPHFFYINSSGFSSGLQVHTWYGDGTNDVNPLYAGFVGGYANFYHPYSAPGIYTVKHVLTQAGIDMDSVIFSYDVRYCQTFLIGSYYDADGDCVYDSATDIVTMSPMTIAVDSNGVPVDTFVTCSGLRYEVQGIPGDVYGFRVIGAPAGMVLTCPASGVLYDTVSTIVNDYHAKSFGFNCSSVTGYDAAILTSTRAGRHTFTANLMVSNQYCTPAPVTVTMNMSPKYDYVGAVPAPTTISGHTLTWVFPALSAIAPQMIYVHGEVPSTSPLLAAGDTVHSSYYVTPLTGDADPANNTVILVDTVRASFDPNDKTVDHTYWITPGPGTRLKYTIRFENTGNDTAFNIHIMDTLSDYVDVRTLELIGASAPVHLGVQHIGGQNIVKFDFPHINLLDSSHHGQCDGMVMYSIKTKNNAPLGTFIDNKASIYFDDNDPVVTNAAQNRIALPIFGVNDVEGTTDGINVFPNPASSELTLSIEKGTYNTVSITNSVGQEVLRQAISSNNAKLNIKALPAGSYFITVRGQNGMKVKQFVKM